MSLQHGHGIEAAVFRIGDLRKIFRNRENVQAACRQSGQDYFDQIRRETKLFPREDIAVFCKDFFIHQRNCLPVEHRKKNLTRIGTEIQQAETSTFVSIAA